MLLGDLVRSLLFFEPLLTYIARRLCAKLYLKAETQQVDRILDEFSRRYWDCNPNSLYGSASESIISHSSNMGPHSFQVWFTLSRTHFYC